MMEEESSNKIQELISKISILVTRMLFKTERCYKEYGIEFPSQKQYVYKLIMSIISPTKIKIPEQINNYGMFYHLDKQLQTIQKQNKNLANSSGQQLPHSPPPAPAPPSQKSHRNNTHITGTKPKLNQQLEVTLADWILHKKIKGETISKKQIKDKAKQVSKDPSFLASQGWLRNFYRRHPTFIQNCHKIQKSQNYERYQHKEQEEGWDLDIRENGVEKWGQKLGKVQFKSKQKQKQRQKQKQKQNDYFGVEIVDRKCTYFGDVNKYIASG